jgi:transposase
MARPSKYTPEVVERIVKAVGLGATYELAALAGGVSYETFRQWRDAKPAFLAALKAAEGQAVTTWLEKIEAASAESWQAAAWKLERRYPHVFGRRVTTIEGPDGGPVSLTVTVVRDRR